MAPRRSAKAARIATGAERRRKKRLEEGALRDLQSACYLDDLTVEGSIEKSLEGHVIKIDLADCNICALPNSIGQLKALTKLDLFNCENITRLPEGIGGLTALETLTLDHCFFLAALPAAIGELKSLTELNLNLCESLVALPDSIGGLAALTILNLGGCYELVALPKAIGDLKALTVLCLDECSSLTELPDTIGGLIALKELDSCNCPIAALPDAIGRLGALTELNLRRCPITALPDTIGELGALTKLNLAGCSSLATLPAAIGELGALTALYLGGCSSLAALPNAIGELKALTTLELRECSSLAALPPTIKAIAKLEVQGWEQPLSGYARFLQLARPRIEAMFHGLIITKIIKGSVSEFWDDLSESKRAKLDDPHDGDAHGEILVRNLMKVLRRQKRRICDICSRVRPLAEDRFLVCWCGAQRYCGEKCQEMAWKLHHSRTCASGHTWSAAHLDLFRSLEQERAEAEGKLEYYRKRLSVNVLNQDEAEDEADWVALQRNLELAKQTLIANNPPPADRER